ncbi:hypothetical protein ACFXKD_20625 [Nocardiopsis aegyptia]|uniref:hypothetical protein n=1 Tax=Nocardiopsis aegyptia TaxID=220378 RepID=UPI00366AC4BE
MSEFGEQVDDNPFASRGFITSAVVVGVIVLLAAVVTARILLVDPEAEKNAPAAAPSPSTAPSASAGPADDSSVCGLTEEDTTGFLRETPEGTQWDLVGRIAAPSVDGHGPGVVETDGFRSCFARTPLGAVLAASNWAAMGAHPELSEVLIERAAAEGPGRDAALADEAGEGTDDSGTDDSASVQITGFRVIEYDGHTANVQIAFTSSYGFDMIFPFHMLWENGDWRIVLANDGGLIEQPYPTDRIDEFVRWYGA